MENRRGRKIAVGLLACLGAGFILLLAAILIVPRFINRGSMGEKLRSEVSKLVNGEFDLKRRDLSLFPMPPVLLADETLNLLQRITSSAQVIEVYLESVEVRSLKISEPVSGSVNPVFPRQTGALKKKSAMTKHLEEKSQRSRKR